ncbi:hypothetical protein [Litoribaculum gwangyangense]|uniref:Uncharacterized protein n=1 Tax=Litoribaculum gwangyangense TaxID=1130722 RepID=A0ABP9CQ25_9FLAO
MRDIVLTLFKQRQHRTFNYQPRFSKENQTDSCSEEDSKTKDFIAKWRNHKVHRTKAKGVMPIRTLILVLVLLLICMYLLEKKYM